MQENNRAVVAASDEKHLQHLDLVLRDLEKANFMISAMIKIAALYTGHFCPDDLSSNPAGY